MKKSKNHYYNKYFAFRLQYEVLLKWMYCDVYDRKIEDVLSANNVHRIAIYGAGDFGGLLYNKLKKTSIEVDCFVDKYSKALHYGMEEIDIVKPDILLEKENLDLIIISALVSAEEILKDLNAIGVKTKIMSLEEIIMRM